MARLRASGRTSLPVVQQPRNPQSESIARSPYDLCNARPGSPCWVKVLDLGAATAKKLTTRGRRGKISSAPMAISRAQTKARRRSGTGLGLPKGKGPEGAATTKAGTHQ